MIMVGAASCARTADEIEMQVHLDSAHSWEMHGRAVDRGTICPTGRRAAVGWLDLEGNPLTLQEWMPLSQRAGATNGREVLFTFVFQYVCTDGSGSFITLEEPNTEGATWRIVEGTRAYADVEGSGSCTLTMAPVEPGDPPEGLPMRMDCTGTVATRSS